jgi:hypothetical protein
VLTAFTVKKHQKSTNHLQHPGDIVKEKDVTVTKKSDAALDAVKYREEKLALEESIKVLQKKLYAAEQDVDRAQAEVDWLRRAPLILEPSVLEEIERVQRSIPMTPPPAKGQIHVSATRSVSHLANNLMSRTRTDLGHQGCHCW